MNWLATALSVVVGGLVMVGLLYLWQERLLYFPDIAKLDQMASAELQAWPSTKDFKGLVAEPDSAVLGTAIIFHGNAGHAGHRAFYCKMLTSLGWRVILAEYPGYGPRAGKLGEASLVADAVETVVVAHRQYGEPILLIGESLGAGVAAATAAQQIDKLVGLLLITPWDRLEQVASYHYRWLPVKWLLRDRYDSVGNLSRFAKPVVVVVAQNDQVVPARFGVNLHSTLAGPKQLVTIPDTDHNNWSLAVDATWWRSVLGFVLK